MEPGAVTDHALVRYIERVHGYNLDPIRQMLLSPAVVTACKLGSGNVILEGGHKAVVRDGKVISVLPKGARGHK